MLFNLSPQKWDAFLRHHAILPTRELNLDLAFAFISVGTLVDFKKYLQLAQDESSENTAEEFLIFCGLLGYGKYLAKSHDEKLLKGLREQANNPRLHIREGVVYALRIIGKKSISRLLKYAQAWAHGSCFEQSAAIEALSDSAFMADKSVFTEVLLLLDLCTASMLEHDSNEEEGYHQLRTTLSRGWTIALEVFPDKTNSMIKRWVNEDDPDINQIMGVTQQRNKILQNVNYEWTGNWLRVMSN